MGVLQRKQFRAWTNFVVLSLGYILHFSEMSYQVMPRPCQTVSDRIKTARQRSGRSDYVEMSR